MTFPATADPVTDDPCQGLEAGGAVDATFADDPAEQLGDCAMRQSCVIEVEIVWNLALKGRHRHHCLDQIAEVMILFTVVEDFHQPPLP